MKTLFTSDTHFDHKRILELSGRPFATIDEMNETFIGNWNAVVDHGDDVYHLGDFGIDGMSTGRANEIFYRLNGNKHLIKGNHDQEQVLDLPWAGVSDSLLVDTGDGQVFLCHYPMITWPKARKGAVHLFGHLHGKWPGTDLSADVGVDCWNYAPVTLPEIKRRMKKQKPNEIIAKSGARM